jgi:hypothetical protein
MWTALRNYFAQYGAMRTSGTVRYMFPFLVGFSAFLTAAALSSVSYSYVRVKASDTSVTAGERFSIDLYAYAHVPVNAVNISLSFPPDAIEIIGVDTGRSVITLWTEEPKVTGNTVVLSGGTFQRGFRGEHLIATVTARAKQTGQAEFFIANLNLLAGDGKGTPVLTGTPDVSRTAVSILEEGAQPPATLSADVALAVVTDIDGDGAVSLSDVSAFLSAWHSRERVYDFNDDGKMTFRDFAIILADSFFGPS